MINFESLDIIFKQRRKWKVDIIVKKSGTYFEKKSECRIGACVSVCVCIKSDVRRSLEKRSSSAQTYDCASKAYLHIYNIIYYIQYFVYCFMRTVMGKGAYGCRFNSCFSLDIVY